jgi:hypothetical protein
MVPTIPKLQDLPSDNAYLVSKWLKQGIKLKGYYPSKRKYIKTFMEVAEYGTIVVIDNVIYPFIWPCKAICSIALRFLPTNLFRALVFITFCTLKASSHVVIGTHCT